jgi:WD40 repeat protein
MRSHTLALTIAVVLTGPGSFAQEMKERAAFSGHTFAVQGVALSPDGKLLASGGGDTRGGELKLWDVATGKEIVALAGYSNSLYALAFSPDGRLLASGGIDSHVKIWDVAGRKHRVTLSGHTDWVHALAFSPDGSRLASAGRREAKLWDVKEGKEVSSFKRRVEAWSMAFSPDLKLLASPNYQEIELWNVPAGREQALLSEHRGAVHAVAFSNDGRTLAAASSWSRYTPRAWISSGEVKLWDVATGRERIKFPGDFGRVFGLAISPDEKALAVLDAGDREADAELKLLEVTTGREVLRHKGKGHSLLAVTFAADGTLYLVESLDRKTLKLWEFPRRKEGGK